MKELNDLGGASLTLHDQHDIRMINYTLTEAPAEALTDLNDSPSICHISWNIGSYTDTNVTIRTNSYKFTPNHML